MRILLLACVGFLMTACATPYQPKGSGGPLSASGGFESNWIAADVLSVEVQGNGYTSDALVREYSLLQSAEKAREAGYSYFSMLDVADKGKTSTYFETDALSGNVSAESVYRPARGIVVRMYKAPPAGFQPGQYFVVADVLATLGAKHLKK